MTGARPLERGVDDLVTAARVDLKGAGPVDGAVVHISLTVGVESGPDGDAVHHHAAVRGAVAVIGAGEFLAVCSEGDLVADRRAAEFLRRAVHGGNRRLGLDLQRAAGQRDPPPVGIGDGDVFHRHARDVGRKRVDLIGGQEIGGVDRDRDAGEVLAAGERHLAGPAEGDGIAVAEGQIADGDVGTVAENQSCVVRQPHRAGVEGDVGVDVVGVLKLQNVAGVHGDVAAGAERAAGNGRHVGRSLIQHQTVAGARQSELGVDDLVTAARVDPERVVHSNGAVVDVALAVGEETRPDGDAVHQHAAARGAVALIGAGEGLAVHRDGGFVTDRHVVEVFSWSVEIHFISSFG